MNGGEGEAQEEERWERGGFERFFQPVVGGAPHKIMRGERRELGEQILAHPLQLRTKRYAYDTDMRATMLWSPRVGFAGVLLDSDRGGFGEREMEREEL